MVISDISSCFFDRCFLHQSAPTEAWRITLSNPTKTWSLGSNQVPLYLHKLLLGLGFWGGGVHCLQGIVFNSAKNQRYVNIHKSLEGGGCTLSTVYGIQFSQKQSLGSNQWYVFIHKLLWGVGRDVPFQWIRWFLHLPFTPLGGGMVVYCLYIWIMYLVLVTERWGNGHSVNLQLIRIWFELILLHLGLGTCYKNLICPLPICWTTNTILLQLHLSLY